MLSHVWKTARAAGQRMGALPLAAAVSLGADGTGQPRRPARLLQACAIVIPISLMTCWAIPQVTWVISPSIDAWAIRAAPGPISRGDLVSFSLRHPLAGPRPVNVTKYALCLPGDRLEIVERQSLYPGLRDGWYYCEGELLGVSKPRAKNGRPLDHFRPHQELIPPGYAFVGSRHPDGFDSRYYGLVPLADLKRMECIL